MIWIKYHDNKPNIKEIGDCYLRFFYSLGINIHTISGRTTAGTMKSKIPYRISDQYGNPGNCNSLYWTPA